MNMQYCPKCGEKTLDFSEGKKWYCPECEFVLYHNCAAAVAVLVRCGDKIMFTRRNQEPAKGKLDLAGGFTDPNESAETTCVRELKEELNVSINPNQLKFLMSLPNVYHYRGIDYNTLDLFFEYCIDERFEAEVAEEEIAEIVWLKKEEIKLEDIAFESQKRFFEQFLKKKA